jgi:glucoamylase
MSHGILNEIYYPGPDLPGTRDMQFIVTDGHGFFSEEKRHTAHKHEYVAPGAPAFRVTNVCVEGRYRIEKEIITDPRRNVLLQRVRFVPLRGQISDYHIHALLSPHLGKSGHDNSARLGDYKGIPMLFAERDGLALAMTSSTPWAGRSVGFVGVSDGWQDLTQNNRLTWFYSRASHGNVALVGEVDLRAMDGDFVLAIGFGRTTDGAGHRARASLLDGFDSALSEYVNEWKAWQAALTLPDPPAHVPEARTLCRIGAAVLRCHEDTDFEGGCVASLSIPWGFAKGDEDLGGYHLVWPRDLVEIAGGFLAVGAKAEARRVLEYLRTTQSVDGGWPQNMWLDGATYWQGVQMDETALPVLLVDLAWREGAIVDEQDLGGFWLMVREAARYIIRNGPATQEGRWEENAGYTPFTLAAEIAALLVAAEFADRHDEPNLARFLRETADHWNASIEEWIFAEGTEMARQLSVDGYYVRVAEPSADMSDRPWRGSIQIRNRAALTILRDDEVVSPDALALVRFGLRAADDPRIASTVRVIDASLKFETPLGPAWRRYNNDGYGEHEDGSPFDGAGIGRPWPLLTGERGHFELAAGRHHEAAHLLAAMGRFASEGGLIPEQVWDMPDVPERELFFGRPSGSAMPLAWAHAEYLKLARSLADGRPFDTPPQTVARYLLQECRSRHAVWRFDYQIRSFCAGKVLRVECLVPARLRWHAGDAEEPGERETTHSGIGVHYVDLPSAHLVPGHLVRFTFYWIEAERWEGAEFTVTVV